MTSPEFGDRFSLTLISGDPAAAAAADAAGVDRVGVDLERLGKHARQAGLGTRLSDHTLGDLAAIGATLRRARLFVRVNPVGPGSPAEIEAVLAAGAQDVMLPFFRTPGEVETFVALVAGRARVVILLETAQALVRVREILAVGGLHEVMLGLNDLRLALGVASHFEVLASPVANLVAQEVARAGLSFTVGGVARPDHAGLPVDPDLVLAQYPRLGATGAWLSRSFHNRCTDVADLAVGVRAIRHRLNAWAAATQDQLESTRKQLAEVAAATTAPAPLRRAAL